MINLNPTTPSTTTPPLVRVTRDPNSLNPFQSGWGWREEAVVVEAGVNNYKMEMLGGAKSGGREVEKEKNIKEDEDNREKDKHGKEEDKGKERDNKQTGQKDKKEEKVRKVKAQFHQQECSSPRLTLPSPEATGATTSVQELNINIKNKISKTF